MKTNFMDQKITQQEIEEKIDMDRSTLVQIKSIVKMANLALPSAKSRIDAIESGINACCGTLK